jgi:two-component system CheB/CheR fusion protein
VTDEVRPHQNPLDPDRSEVDLGEDAVPTRGYSLTPLVGLGGSAGSIQALQRFFDEAPVDAGVIYVVVIHLSPEHESNLAELLGHHTSMSVRQVTGSIKAEPDHVYVIPPNHSLSAIDGHLGLGPLHSPRGRRVAVDLFFRTLADSYGPHAVAVVLSGADGDGAIGIKRIKERGGLTIVQDPDEAEFPGMPRTAINTGMVDWILPVAEMPRRIQDYVEREPCLDAGGTSTAVASTQLPNPALDAAVEEVLAHVHTLTGRDFADYKRGTVMRRLARRMQVNNITELTEYLSYLRTHQGEAGALLQDLLISVTNFFRDSPAFAALEARIPDLFAGKGMHDTVRVWVPGCATGEEAFSIAMLLLEHARTLETPPQLCVFATDLDKDAIQVGRTGLYPATIQADVSEERLDRFFGREQGGYRIRREVREVVLFAVHDVLRDSPFSRLDLVSCRNLLIYLNPAAQHRALELFHFALRKDGLLFLGTSELVSDESNLFAPIDAVHRIYAARATARIGVPIMTGTTSLSIAARPVEGYTELPLSARSSRLAPARPVLSASEDLATPTWAELHSQLLERFGPPSLVVNPSQNIVHLSETAGHFLQHPAGEPTIQLLSAIHPGLRGALRTALFLAQEEGEGQSEPAPFQVDGTMQYVTIRVARADDLAPDFLLVSFLTSRAKEELQTVDTGSVSPVVQQLEHEVASLQGRMTRLNAQYEESTEALSASNEELQAVNEELRSATEELETSREELQSINEELTTVNQELKSNVEELGEANTDLHNLMSAGAIAIVFLDLNLRITRFTPSAVDLFRLIPADVGRPLSNFNHRLNYPELEQDAREVLAHGNQREREISSGDAGLMYLARWVPYRSIQGEIDGVVLTLIDISELSRARQELGRSHEQLTEALAQTEEARRAAEQALKVKDQFLAILSHELRTPLTPVVMATQMLSRQEELSPRSREWLALIERNVAMENGLINELLDLSRIAHGKLHLQLEPTSLHQVIRSAIETVVPDLTARDQKLTLELGAGNDLVLGDPARLQQVFANLLTNASRHSAKQASIEVRTSRSGPRIVAQVIDHGDGIAAEALEGIFEAFRQLQPGTPSHSGGLGLGLAITRAIVQEHGGRIEAESDGEGKGAAFRVELVLKEPTAA